MIIGGKSFDLDNHTYLMGILNVTPDSFSDGGRFKDPSAALFHVEEMIKDGADIIDVGGESTRPGYEKISEKEEITRVFEIIRSIKENFNIPVSLDTYKTPVARAGLEAGVDMINDIWGLKNKDYPDMGKLLSEKKVPAVLMHNREKPSYGNFLEELFEDLSNIIDTATGIGMEEGNIIIDPGIGFGKTTEENLLILNYQDRIKLLGVPYLIGASRKSVIGDTLKLPVDERLEGTLAITAMSVIKGASFVRVHDVRENKRVIEMTEAIING